MADAFHLILVFWLSLEMGEQIIYTKIYLDWWIRASYGLVFYIV